MEPARFLRGQVVEVKSEAEIRATLDADGRLDGLPFMPEMARYCGQSLRVYRRADKTCVEGHGLRRLHDTVFLEHARCDAAQHDGCERDCLMFWKEAWLKPARDAAPALTHALPSPAALSPWAASLITQKDGAYVCQSTELASATSPIRAYDPTHLIREWRNGELTLGLFVDIVARALVNKARLLLGRREIGGLAGPQKRNSRGDLDLQAGDIVEVRDSAEIAATLDPNGRNNGLSFEPDMADLVGKRFKVAAPVHRIIQETTGSMTAITRTVKLEGVVCQGLCSKNCPRANPIFWRESWLRRVEEESETATATNEPMAAFVKETA